MSRLMEYLRQQMALPEHLRDVPREETPEEKAAYRADLERRIQEDIDATEARNANASR